MSTTKNTVSAPVPGLEFTALYTDVYGYDGLVRVDAWTDALYVFHYDPETGFYWDVDAMVIPYDYHGLTAADVARDPAKLEAWLDEHRDYGFSADDKTDEELADELEIDPAELVAFIERANAQ